MIRPALPDPFGAMRPDRPELAYRHQAQKLKLADPKLQNIVKTDRIHRMGGEPIAINRNSTSMEKLRRWSAQNPVASKTAAIASIVALSASLALVSGWAIDQLAHMTDRKNDKVGLVFGAMVGLAIAFTQTVQLFSLARRGEIACRANAFSSDSHTAEGQCFQLIRQRNPVLLHAILSNARSEMAASNEKLIFSHDDCFNALNTLIREGWTRKRWSDVFEESEHEPTDGRPYFRATTDAPSADIHKDKYYISLHRSSNDFLDSEVSRAFGIHRDSMEQILAAAKVLKRQREQPSKNEFKPQPGEKLETPMDGARQVLLKAAGRKSNDALDPNWGKDIHSGSFEQIVEKISKLDDKQMTEFAAYKSKAYDPEVDVLRKDLLLYIDNAQVGHEGGKSWVRVDELTKIGPALMGLRPASLHSWVQNIRDALFSFVSSLNADTQGRAAGTSIFSFVPFALLVSVVGVLCLGMSSTSPSNPTTGGGQQNSNTGSGIGNGAVVFPPFESVQNPNSMLPNMKNTQSSQWGAYVNSPSIPAPAGAAITA